jgi:hypothetical protein
MLARLAFVPLEPLHQPLKEYFKTENCHQLQGKKLAFVFTTIKKFRSYHHLVFD